MSTELCVRRVEADLNSEHPMRAARISQALALLGAACFAVTGCQEYNLSPNDDALGGTDTNALYVGD